MGEGLLLALSVVLPVAMAPAGRGMQLVGEVPLPPLAEPEPETAAAMRGFTLFPPLAFA